MSLKKTGSLQIEAEATSKNTLFWTIQKIAICLFLIFLCLVFLGLTGPGILGSRQVKNANLTVAYQSFMRAGALSQINIEINETVKDGLNLYFSSDYMSHIEVVQIFPTPTKSEIKDNYIIYTFSGNSKTYHINILFEPKKIGWQQVAIGKVGSSSVVFNQWAFP